MLQANKSFLSRFVNPHMARAFSTTAQIRDDFEAAYEKRRAELGKVAKRE
jgi:hypothetical protein